MSPPNLLTIPREIRQRILKYTRPDYDLRVDCKPAFIGWKFVPQYTHKETSRWVRDLCLVNSEIARDMVWVQGQWVKRGEELAREQKGKRTTRIGSAWTKNSRKAEKQRATERKKAALKERHPLFEEEVTFGYSRVLSWVACFAQEPEGWEKLLHLGYTGWLTGDRLMIIRREGFNNMSNRSARSHWVVSLA
ncbi:hypothetical protein E2P81_ATG04275 [Venturia nashicola]|nr:hypothetical protein E2P81_ATG04275 [Venturia nashicola]